MLYHQRDSIFKFVGSIINIEILDFFLSLFRNAALNCRLVPNLESQISSGC